MADNTLLNPGSIGGDTVRDLARQGGTVKTQTVQLDLGGSSANAEVLITAGQQLMAASVPVVIASNQPAFPVTGTFFQDTQPVSGSFYQVTQPVSIATMPTTPVTGAFFQATQPVSGSFFQATQPISATALPLPTGAATDTAINNANPYRGTCTYSSGTTGTVVVASGARVVSISVMASLAATVTIFGGATIAVPAGTSFDERWTGFVGPGNIVFTNTSSYYVAVNQ